MKYKKFFAFVLTGCMLLGNSAAAAETESMEQMIETEQETVAETGTEEGAAENEEPTVDEDTAVSEEPTVDEDTAVGEEPTVDEDTAVSEDPVADEDMVLAEPIQLSAEETTEIFGETPAASPTFYLTTPDPYEENNTPETAYPYDKVPTLTTKITKTVDLYQLGLKGAGLHSATDEDWFKINLVQGNEYFLDLRNVGTRNWSIRVYYIKADGSSYFYTPDKKLFDGRAEKYCTFIAKDTGTHYIMISSNGDWEDTMYYYFYVGPQYQYFDIENLKTYGNVYISGSTYKSFVFDMTDIVPKESKVVSLSLTNDFTEGTKCNELDKKMVGGGKTYYNSSAGSENMSMSGASLSKVWTISGRCSQGLGAIGCWSPKMNGRIKCKMAPYPGNEVTN